MPPSWQNLPYIGFILRKDRERKTYPMGRHISLSCGDHVLFLLKKPGSVGYFVLLHF
jgi:hypothetical protein